MTRLALFAFLGFFWACKEAPKATPEQPPIATKVIHHAYPEALQKVFEAHGGISLWQKQRTLSFELPREETAEAHTIDLWSRKDHIMGPGYSLGYDGREVWASDPEKQFKGDPVFYHNLMFYFYAMPFVFADDGLIFDQTDPLEFQGKTYPGIKIGFKEGVGASHRDEYYLYYEPGTHRMAWLGYTVTYFSGVSSADVHWIRYNDWSPVGGLLLPASITWYEAEGNTPKEVRDRVYFRNRRLSESPEATGFYQAPPEAEPLPQKG